MPLNPQESHGGGAASSGKGAGKAKAEPARRPESAAPPPPPQTPGGWNLEAVRQARDAAVLDRDTKEAGTSPARLCVARQKANQLTE